MSALQARTRARRNVGVLALAQALAMMGMITVVTSSSLAGQMIAPHPSLATLAVGLQFTATMCATIPASLLMARIGRRPGFLLGATSQAMGGLAAAVALLWANFPLFCVAGVLLGIANAFTLYYRFAAADTAEESFRPKAISLVMAGGVAAALAGPEVARWSRDLIAPVAFAGAFLAIAGLACLNFVVLCFLDIPRPSRLALGGGRKLSEFLRNEVFLVALASGMVAYGTMSLVMTATPLAVIACGYPFEDAAFVIQWHALGMFAPAFFTGHLISRFGVLAIMKTGAVVLIASVLIAASGQSVAHFWASLTLVGVGWSFLFVGATNLLTETYRQQERAKIQAVNDFCVFATTAVASFSAGALEYSLGWTAVNIAVLPILGLIAAALVWLGWTRRRAAPA